MTAPATPAKQSERLGSEEMEMATIGGTPAQDLAAAEVESPDPTALEPSTESSTTAPAAPILAPALEVSDTTPASANADIVSPADAAHIVNDQTQDSPDLSNLGAGSGGQSGPSEDALSATEWEQVEKPSSSGESPVKDGASPSVVAAGAKGIKSPNGGRFGAIMRRDSSKASSVGKQDGRGSVEASPVPAITSAGKSKEKEKEEKEKDKEGGLGKKVDGVRKVLKSGMFGSSPKTAEKEKDKPTTKPTPLTTSTASATTARPVAGRTASTTTTKSSLPAAARASTAAKPITSTTTGTSATAKSTSLVSRLAARTSSDQSRPSAAERAKASATGAGASATSRPKPAVPAASASSSASGVRARLLYLTRPTASAAAKSNTGTTATAINGVAPAPRVRQTSLTRPTAATAAKTGERSSSAASASASASARAGTAAAGRTVSGGSTASAVRPLTTTARSAAVPTTTTATTASTITKLKEDLASSKLFVTELASKVEALQLERAAYESSHLASREEIQGVRAELEGLKAVKVGLEARVADLAEQLEKKEREDHEEEEAGSKEVREELERRVQFLEGEVDSLTTKLQEGEEKGTEKERELQKIQDELEKVKREMGDALKREVELKGLLAGAKVAAQQLEAAQAETSILTAKISYLETTVEDDKQKLAQLLQDEEAAAAKYTAQHQQLLDAQSRVADLDAQLRDAEVLLKAGEAGKEADKAKLAELTKELEGLAVLKADKEALEDKIRHFEGEQAGQIKEKAELEQRIKAYENEIAALEKKVEERYAAGVQDGKIGEHHALELSALKAQVADTHSQLSTAHATELDSLAASHAAALSAQNAEHATALGEMSAKADSLAEEHKKAAEQLQDALKQKETLEQQASEHAATLGEAADKAGEAEAQLSILREEILALQAAQDSGNAAKEAHAAEISRLQSELEAAKADAEQSKQDAHAESQAALDKLKVEAEEQAHHVQIAKAHADKLEKELEEALLREKVNAEAREGKDVEVEGLRKERDAIKEELEGLTSMMDMNKAHFQQALEEAGAKHAKEMAEVEVRAEEKGEALDKAQKAVDEAEIAKAAAESALQGFKNEQAAASQEVQRDLELRPQDAREQARNAEARIAELEPLVTKASDAHDAHQAALHQVSDLQAKLVARDEADAVRATAESARSAEAAQMQEQLEAAQAERDAVKAEHADRERVAQATADEVEKVKEALERERAEKKALEQLLERMQEEMSSPGNVSPPRSAAAVAAPVTPVKPAVGATAQGTPARTTEAAPRELPVTPSKTADAPATPVKQATPVAVASSEALSPADENASGAAPETPSKPAVPAQIGLHETAAPEAPGETPKKVSANDKVEEEDETETF